MILKNIKEGDRLMEWYFPEKMEELSPLLLREGFVPHGGGTFLLRGGSISERGINGLISLSKLPLGEVKLKGDNVELGASTTFSGAVSKMNDRQSVLSKALSSAAATPIRNRATIGGSVAALPPWSDLIAPLSVLEATVSVFGKNAGEYSFVEFMQKSREILSGSIICNISVPISKLAMKNFYHRETRVAFDYPAFTVAINADMPNGKVDEIKIAVSGTVERVNRLRELEAALTGRDISVLKSHGLAKDIDIKFGRKSASPEYIAHAARVAIERGLASLAS